MACVMYGQALTSLQKPLADDKTIIYTRINNAQIHACYVSTRYTYLKIDPGKRPKTTPLRPSWQPQPESAWCTRFRVRQPSSLKRIQALSMPLWGRHCTSQGNSRGDFECLRSICAATPDLRFQTVQQLPFGGDSCLREFWLCNWAVYVDYYIEVSHFPLYKRIKFEKPSVD